MSDRHQAEPSASNSGSPSEQPDALVTRLQDGDSIAASRLYELYAPRLIGFLRHRMNPALNRRLDPEDVLQSAFRSFFRVVGDADWDAQGRAERVWSLLLAIALNKLNANLRFHHAGKRSVKNEVYDVESLSHSDLQQAELILADEFDRVMRQNTPRYQQILEHLLNGHEESEVAELNGCSVRTVYRVLERVTAQLQARLSE